MCKGLLGKKLGMTGVFAPDGSYVPVTVIQAGPCVVAQVKTKAKDRYDALQLGFEPKRASRVNKPMTGHLAKSGASGFYKLREFSVDNPEEYSPGQTISLDIFKIGEMVNISGKTKGRGFSGVIKRHGFRGGSKTHGSHCVRIPGSIGQCAWPAKVHKGKKMPGQYGNVRKTVRNLEIIEIREDLNVILVKGAVPGFRSGFVEIHKQKFQKKS